MRKLVLFMGIIALILSCNNVSQKSDKMENKKFTNIFVFGDGLSDMGRYGKLTNNQYPPSPPFYEGRWTNGKVWIENLADSLKINLKPENNFAMGGATTGYYNINEQLRAALKLDSTALIMGLMTQIDLFLSQNAALDTSALYVVWAGGHDFGSYLDYGQPDLKQYPPAENIKTAIEKLQSKGAKYFIVGNMPDISATPAYANSDKKENAKQLVTDFNSAIDKIIADFEKEGKSKIYKVDAFAIFTDIAMNAQKYGFKYWQEAYLPMDYIDFTNPLAPSKYKTVPNADKGMKEDEFISFWGLAAGRKVHELIGIKVYEQFKN